MFASDFRGVFATRVHLAFFVETDSSLRIAALACRAVARMQLRRGAPRAIVVRIDVPQPLAQRCQIVLPRCGLIPTGILHGGSRKLGTCPGNAPAATDAGAASRVLAALSCDVVITTPARSPLRSPLSLPTSVASLSSGYSDRLLE